MDARSPEHPSVVDEDLRHDAHRIDDSGEDDHAYAVGDKQHLAQEVRAEPELEERHHREQRQSAQKLGR